MYIWATAIGSSVFTARFDRLSDPWETAKGFSNLTLYRDIAIFSCHIKLRTLLFRKFTYQEIHVIETKSPLVHQVSVRRDAKETRPVCVLNPIKFAFVSFKQKQGVLPSTGAKGTITPQVLAGVNKRTPVYAITLFPLEATKPAITCYLFRGKNVSYFDT